MWQCDSESPLPHLAFPGITSSRPFPGITFSGRKQHRPGLCPLLIPNATCEGTRAKSSCLHGLLGGLIPASEFTLEWHEASTGSISLLRVPLLILLPSLGYRSQEQIMSISGSVSYRIILTEHLKNTKISQPQSKNTKVPGFVWVGAYLKVFFLL